ncbi:MAG TPA: hypothetical protein VI603_00805 [Saprospiraceae bacterium]|nr:hypothetical protein [Saprospiraceae bacterium]
MKTKIYTLILSSISTTCLFAQDKFDLRVIHNTRSDFGLAYNFFTGDNTDDFRTTIKGFGSGFLLDAFSGRFSQDILLIGTEGVNITLGAGAAIAKYRFSEPLVFYEENGEFHYTLDNDPTHTYGSGFFSNDKSKLVIGSFIFPANVNIDLGKFYFSAGGSFDLFVTGKHKRKYTVNGDRVKELIRNDNFNDYPISKAKWGLGAMLLHKESNVSAGVTYMLTPFFKENSGFPEMREVRVSFAYDLSLFDGHR